MAMLSRISPKRVLLVEDDKDISLSVRQILELEGFEVDAAYDGQQALDKLRAGEIPDVIFLDLMMPKVDGFQFHAEFTKDPAFNKVPIVVLTGDGNIIAKGQRVGAALALKKPADMDDIINAAKKFAG